MWRANGEGKGGRLLSIVILDTDNEQIVYLA